MQRTAKTSRFLIDFFSKRGAVDSESLASHSDLLRYVLSLVARTANSSQVLNDLAQRLIRLAEHAYNFRDADTLREASSVLMSLPTAAAQQAGKFYQALAIKRGKHTNEAQSLLEAVASDGPLAYRARAIQALGALYHDRGQPAEALRFHLEAARAASDKSGRDSLATLLAHWEISHVKSDFGDHQNALAVMYHLLPLVHNVAKEIPFCFYSYQANVAYELAQVGRIAEAEAALAIALASPFAPAYPEWAETRDEIAAKRLSASHSVVAIDRAPETAASPDAQPRREVKPARAAALGWLEHEGRVHISITFALAVRAVMARCATAKRATEFLCDSSQPRAPPVLA